jgi:hypothetical protein
MRQVTSESTDRATLLLFDRLAVYISPTIASSKHYHVQVLDRHAC